VPELTETVGRLAEAWRAYQPARVPSMPSMAV